MGNLHSMTAHAPPQPRKSVIGATFVNGGEHALRHRQAGGKLTHSS
jgi:hypothetical protein